MKYIFTLLYLIICIFLFWFILSYVSNNFTIIESFSELDPTYSAFDIDIEKTSHNVNLPINTTSQCSNMCGPNAQCSITREQCTSDIDCYGCQPPIKPIKYPFTEDIVGENDAGKLIYNQNPQYSTLTTDTGTQAAIFNNKNPKVPKPYLGIDNWKKSASIGMQYFYKSQNYDYLTQPNKFIQLPEYKVQETATGLFEDYGPLPSNAYL